MKELLKFQKRFRLSHIVSMAIGAVATMYIDVLFLHDFDSSTISALMDTVMASSAIYTIVKVKDWYTDKINEKGFEQANVYITLYHEAKNKAELLHLNISAFYDHLGIQNLNLADPDYQKRLGRVEELHSDYRDHMLKLRSHLEILRVWNLEVHPDKKEKLYQSIGHLHTFTVTSHDMIQICKDVNGMARKKIWEFKDISFKINYALTQLLPSEWLTSWRELFKISKSSTTD